PAPPRPRRRATGTPRPTGFPAWRSGAGGNDPRSWGLGRVVTVEDAGELVPVRIAQISDIERRLVIGPRARPALVAAAMGQPRRVPVADLRGALGLEGEHGAIAGTHRLAIEGRAKP